MSSNIREKDILSQTEAFIRKQFESEGSGHDWWHIYRVKNLALELAKSEGGNFFIIEMAALLHDLDDWKLSESEQNSKSEAWLKKQTVSVSDSKHILEIIEQVSFKGAGVKTSASSLEAQIVQDADRMDAIGAIGIARTFAYGGHKSRLLYHPEIKPEMHQSFEAYKKTTAPTINHFYEKLLLLKDRMNTSTAKQMAEERHKYMELFLDQFFREWEGKK